MDNQENYYNGDFKHGFVNGVEGIDKSTYEGYLSSQVSHDWLQDRLIEKRDELNQIDIDILSTQEKQKTFFDKLQDALLYINTESRKVTQLDKELNQNQEKITELQNRYKQAASPYSLLAGILYLFAGITFVVGDLIISHEIVAYALNIRNDVEAWSFAVGLAMLSVLLKPAYERLVETPYLIEYNAKSKRVYAWFQGFLMLFAMGTMFILGWFRYEAYKTDKLKEGVNRTIKNLQLEATPIDPTAGSSVSNQQMIQKIDEQLKIYDRLNLDLVNSIWALASFVLSGLLFAIAGAICLGISFPIVQAYWFRWLQAGPKLKKIDKEQKQLIEQQTNTNLVLSQHFVQKNILENDLKQLTEIDLLKDNKQIIKKEIEGILEKIRLMNIDRRQHTFNDGFVAGEVNIDAIDNKDIEDLRKTFVQQIKNTADTQPETNNTQQRVYRNNGLRPHQALRKAISEQFNEKDM